MGTAEVLLCSFLNKLDLCLLYLLACTFQITQQHNNLTTRNTVGHSLAVHCPLGNMVFPLHFHMLVYKTYCTMMLSWHIFLLITSQCHLQLQHNPPEEKDVTKRKLDTNIKILFGISVLSAMALCCILRAIAYMHMVWQRFLTDAKYCMSAAVIWALVNNKTLKCSKLSFRVLF